MLTMAHEEIDGIADQTPTRDISAVTSMPTPVIQSPTKQQRLESVRKNLLSPDADKIDMEMMSDGNQIMASWIDD